MPSRAAAYNKEQPCHDDQNGRRQRLVVATVLYIIYHRGGQQESTRKGTRRVALSDLIILLRSTAERTNAHTHIPTHAEDNKTRRVNRNHIDSCILFAFSLLCRFQTRCYTVYSLLFTFDARVCFSYSSLSSYLKYLRFGKKKNKINDAYFSFVIKGKEYVIVSCVIYFKKKRREIQTHIYTFHGAGLAGG